MLQACVVALAKDPRASSVEVNQGVRRAHEKVHREQELAATGSAHGLDRGPLASLVLRAARALTTAHGPTAAGPRPDDRQVWAAVGVVRDEVSSTVLGLALPAAPRGATGAALSAWAERVQPVVLTLRQLRLDPPTWCAPVPGALGRPGAGGAVVRVVENPVVLTAVADRALAEGVAPPPVLCTSGWPSAAATSVLRGLRSAAGSCATTATSTPTASASWDAALGPAMREAQQVVEEEALLDDLVTEALRRP